MLVPDQREQESGIYDLGKIQTVIADSVENKIL